MSLGTIGYTNIGRSHGERVLGPGSNHEVVGQSIITANVGYNINEKETRKDIIGVQQLGTFRSNEELVAVPNDLVFYKKGSRGKTGTASGIDGFVAFNGMPIENVQNDDDLRRLYPYLGFSQGSTQLDESVAVTRSGIAVGMAGSFSRLNDSPFTFTPGKIVRVVRPSIDQDKRDMQVAARRKPNHPDAPPLTKLSAFMEPFEISDITGWFRKTSVDIFRDLSKGSGGRFNVPKVMHDMDVLGKSPLSDRDLVNVMRKQMAAAQFWSALTTGVRYGLVTPTAMNERIQGGAYTVTPLNISSSQADAVTYQNMLNDISLDNPHANVIVYDEASHTHVLKNLSANEQAQRARAFDEVAKDWGVRLGLASAENVPHLMEDTILLETMLLPTLGFASTSGDHIRTAEKLFNVTVLPDRRDKLALHTIQRNVRGSIGEQIKSCLQSCEEDYVRSVATIYDYYATDIIGTASNHSRPGDVLHLVT